MPAKKKIIPEEEAATVQTDLELEFEAEAQQKTPIQEQPDASAPHTDLENSPEAAAIRKDDPPVDTVLQTDLESGPEAGIPIEDAFEFLPESAAPQTDLNNEPDEPGVQEVLQEISQTEPVSEKPRGEKTDPDSAPGVIEPSLQTDTEETEEMEDSPGSDLVTDISKPISQTDTEEAPRPRRRRQAAASASQSDTGEEAAAPAAARSRRTTRRNLSIVSIDERRSVETEEDKARNDLIDLLESQKSGRILTGTIQGVENTTDTPPNSLAVIYHGNFKVIIPAEEAVLPPDDLRGRSQSEVMHYLITKRLGAEVDYIVKGIDAQAGIAVASRLEAMRSKRRQYYFGTDRDGNNLLYSGVCAEARVVSVIRAGIFVDLCGLEVYIPLRELSYQRMMDAASQYRPGQRILVKILDIDRSDRDNIRVSASVKQAGENPYEKALRRYSVGDCYVGTVSMVDTTGVFVALDGGIDCLCSYPKRGRPPRGARVTVRILGINFDTNRIWGAITHIAAAR